MTLTIEQLAQRTTYIGASDAAAVLGISRYKTPIQLWGEKTGIVPAEDISDKLPVKFGNFCEQFVAELFEEKMGVKLHRVKKTIHHKDHAFIACNLDRRIVGRKVIVECKTANQFKSKDYSEENSIPQEYVAQVLHQLACCPDMEYGYLAVLIGNTDFVVRRIERDSDLIEKMIAREVEFWNTFVVPKVMPTKVMASDGDVLAKVFPESGDQSALPLTDEANRLCESLDALKLDKDAIETVIDTEKNLLKVLLGENSVGLSDKYKVTWKTQETTRIDSKKLKAECPEVFEKYSNTTETRVLRTALLSAKK